MKNLLYLLILFLSIPIISQTANGNIETYISTIIDNVPGNNGDNYIDPSNSELAVWDSIIGFLLDNNIVDARNSANGINYKVTEFTDTSITPNQIFYVLEKQNSASNNYWGTYVFSKTPERNNLIIQAPHIKYDTNTGKQAIYCFKNTLAKAVFISGTHRCNSSNYSSCSGTTSTCSSGSQSFKKSDMAHNVTTMFQKTTQNIFTNITNSVFIQLHGFGKKSSDPYVIMSNGTRETPLKDYASLIKSELVKEDSSLTFQIAHINKSWTRLIGFTNTQGRLINNSSNHCNTSATSTSGRFIHIEQEKSKLRNDVVGWTKMSNALKNVFQSTLSLEINNLKESVFVSPNPTLDKVLISAKNVEKIEVYNLLGQKVFLKIFKNKNNPMLDLTKQSKGVYFIKIKTINGLALKKVIRL